MSDMTAEELKAKVLRFHEEIFQKKNLDAADEFYSVDMIRHDAMSPEPLQGREAWKERIRELWAAFPDAEMSIEDMIVEGNKMAQRWVIKGTHQGEYSGIPATGKEVTITGMSFARLEDGQLVEAWNEINALGLLRQLGLAPSVEREMRR